MKHVIKIMAIICLALTSSCSGKFEVGHEVESGLYILKSGRQDISISDDNSVYEMYIYKSGLNDDVYAVSLVVDIEDLVEYNAKYMSSYRILPGNSYEFDKRNMLVGKDDIKSVVSISFIKECIPDGTSVLPIRLKWTSGTAEASLDDEYSVTYLFVTKE